MTTRSPAASQQRRRYGSVGNKKGGEQRRLLSDTAYCDHYAGDGPSENEDNDNIIGGTNSNDDDDGGGGGGGGDGGDGDEDDFDGGGGHGGLTPVGRGRRRGGGGGGGGGIIVTWKCLCRSVPLLLASLSLGGLLYANDLTQTRTSSLSMRLSRVEIDVAMLNRELDDATHRLSVAESTLADHGAVVARFADSVSNGDVLSKLRSMEEESREREKRVHDEMEDTKDEIRGVLKQTKAEIDTTVSDATDVINSQVLTVQSSLSQYIRATQDQFSTENTFMVYQLAGTFTLIGCLISMWHMTSHLRAFRQPFVQRKILAILWMCPIYSVTSWLSLVAPEPLEGYLGILKDMYEAYVIYTFLSFCIAVLGKGDRDAVVRKLAQSHDEQHHPLSTPVPRWLVDVVCCCRCFCPSRRRVYSDDEAERRMQVADAVLIQCQVCAMQFVFLRPLLTTALFVLKKLHYHGPMFGRLPFGIDDGYSDSDADGDGTAHEGGGGGGAMDYRSPQFYIVILQNVSVFLAFSGLLNFYHAVQEDLKWCRPFPKFLCIKGVVFMTFWQGIALSLLATTTDIIGSDDDDDDQVDKYAKQAQNFLICLEMLGFSIAHFYCFPVEEWEEGYEPEEDRNKYGDKMALGDFLQDLKVILRHSKKKDALKSDDSISTVLEEDEELGDPTDKERLVQSLLDKYESSSGPANRSAKLKRIDGKGVAVGNVKDPDRTTPPRKFQTSKVLTSLKAMNAPSELCQATALLLHSCLLDEVTANLLTRDILDQPMEGASLNADSEEGGGRGDGQEQIQIDPVGPESIDQSQSLTESGTISNNDAEITPPGNEDTTSSSEVPYLFSPPSVIGEMLRPSIFTMHSMSPDST